MQDITTAGPRPRPIEQLPMVEFRSSTSALVFQSGTGWSWLLAAALVVGAAAWFGYWWQGLAAVAVVAAPVLAYCLVHDRTHRYWLDGGRLFMRRGIFMRSEEEVELYRIKDVRVSFSVIQQMFGNGDIAITSSDVTGGLDGVPGGRNPVTIRNVTDARAIREELRNRVEAVRERRGVREFDLS